MYVLCIHANAAFLLLTTAAPAVYYHERTSTNASSVDDTDICMEYDILHTPPGLE